MIIHDTSKQESSPDQISIVEAETRSAEYQALPVFAAGAGILLICLIVGPDLWHHTKFSQMRSGLVAAFIVASLPFGVSLYYLDLQTRKYILKNETLYFVHKTLPFLNRQFDLEEFTHFRIVNSKGMRILYLYRKRGFEVSIPIIGTVPVLIKAIDSVHPMALYPSTAKRDFIIILLCFMFLLAVIWISNTYLK